MAYNDTITNNTMSPGLSVTPTAPKTNGLTYNQVNDIISPQIGRDITPYEHSKYATESSQTLASVKDTHSKLNPESLSDYLTLQGMDNSLKARQELGAKYGISNIGTAEGNTALLGALKTGTQPQQAPIAGSVSQAAPQTPVVGTTGSPNLVGTTPNAPKYDGDGNLIQPTQATTKSPLDSAYEIQQAKQKAVNDIDTTLAGLVDAKRKEIARSGGVVNEASIQSEILREQAPLLARRKELAGEYTQANQAYQRALAEDKASSALAEKQREFAITSGQKDTQFTQKLEQSGWKSAKVNDYDAAGNVIGSHIAWSLNPSSSSTSNAVSYIPTSSGNSGITPHGVTNVGNTEVIPKITIADGATPEQVLKSLISGNPVPVKGSTTPISQQSLYNAAIDSMLGVPSVTGSRLPAGAAIAIQDKKADIMNAYGLSELDVNAARAQMKGISAANTALLGTAAFTKTYAATADDNLKLALDQSDKVARTGAKIVNNYKNWITGNFTPAGDLSEFETYIYTAAREYAKVTSGGAKSAQGLTDSAQKEVDKLINASQSPEAFKQVVTAMRNDMNNVIKNFDKQTSAFPGEVKKLFGIESPKENKTPTLIEPSNIPAGYYQASDGLLYKK